MKITGAQLATANTMGVREFGDALLRTRDLDPVYVGLVGADLPESQLCRWLLAYWCFYHVGLASTLSEFEGGEYWDSMRVAAKNEEGHGPRVHGYPADRWPRAAERRHFRGAKCVAAVDWLSKATSHPEDHVRFLASATKDSEVMSIVQGWPMFGPWIAFKCADMMERVYGSKISFDPNLALMYEQPRAALDLLASGTCEVEPPIPGVTPSNKWWYHYLLSHYRDLPAPPRYDRFCGPQEVETVLCKWKSYRGGHYHIGKDIHEQRLALAGWGETAGRIARAYPAEVGLLGEKGPDRAAEALYNETMRTP